MKKISNKKDNISDIFNEILSGLRNVSYKIVEMYLNLIYFYIINNINYFDHQKANCFSKKQPGSFIFGMNICVSKIIFLAGMMCKCSKSIFKKLLSLKLSIFHEKCIVFF